jgi:tetratricopeptide (TPR) repeat protein
MQRYIVALTLCAIAGVVGAQATAPDSGVPLYDNLGTLHQKISTTSPVAQQYFDQGLRLTYGFNHDEAIAAFKKAAELDDKCPMCYWGQALAMGPNINMSMDLKQEPVAFELAQKALALSKAVKTTVVERALISALAQRYAKEPGDNRAARDQVYAQAMREAAQRFPANSDVTTLFAESLMDLQPWDYWTADGQPKGAINEIIATLEAAIKLDEEHPGACHYYIHAVEASHQPQRALACAQRLPGLMPGAGHLVHMPAHTFVRMGMYQEAITANEHAAHADEKYIKDRNPRGMYPLMYYNHNLHFLYFANMTAGHSTAALAAARQLTANIPAEVLKEVPPAEFFISAPVQALARFGKWDEILKEPQPAEGLNFTKGMWHFTRGLAYSAKSAAEKARAELAALNALASTQPADHPAGFNFSKVLLGVAGNVLTADIEQHAGHIDVAIKLLQQAIAIEDGLIYDEPPDWFQPVRQRLGATLLAAGKAADAEKVYLDDLARNPENGWSLYGLKLSLDAQKKTKDLAAVEQRFKKAWSGADVTLNASRF